MAPDQDGRHDDQAEDHRDFQGIPQLPPALLKKIDGLLTGDQDRCGKVNEDPAGEEHEVVVDKGMDGAQGIKDPGRHNGDGPDDHCLHKCLTSGQ